MFPSSGLRELLQHKNTRLLLAALCAALAASGIHQLLTGAVAADWLRGGGNVLVWGGFTAFNLAKAYGRSTSGLNILLNIGLLLVVAGWVAK